MQKVLKTISIVSLLGISTLTHIYANTFKYHPKNKQELLKLIRDNNVYLGDINTSKITDMSGLFWVVPKNECKEIAERTEKVNGEQVRARLERSYQLCLEVSVEKNELEKIKRKDFSGIEKWNVSNVANMVGMFAGAESFNQPLDSWNVSKVKDMSAMFLNATSFNQPLNNWNVSKVTHMAGMFAGAESFNQPLDSWNVSNVTNMNNMFAFAKSFNQPLDSWNVSNVTNMDFMFYGAESFNQPLNSWNVGNVRDMSEMFAFAKSFNQNLDSWDVSQVGDNMYNMFYSSPMQYNPPKWYKKD